MQTFLQLVCLYQFIYNILLFYQVGNPTVTLIALCALDDMNLEQEIAQISVVDLGGVHILLNLLKTQHISCEVSAKQESSTNRRCVLYSYT